MAAAMIDDVIGWVALSLLLGPVGGPHMDFASFARTVVLSAAFAAIMLVVGRRLIEGAVARLERASAADVGPGRVLSLVILLALFGAAATHALGLHVLFGGFIVGLTVGRSARVRERTRVAIEDFVMNVFAPVFFASIGLRVDFVQGFDARLCALVFLLATLPKLVGCAFGARLGGMQWRQAAAVGFGMNARGAMGVILAEIARASGLLRDSMFVALVVMSLLTSLTSGPAMKWLLYREEAEEDVVTLLRRGAFVGELHATNPTEAITELVRSLGSLLTGRKRLARSAVIERELVAPTGLGDEVAIPHAALEGLTRPPARPRSCPARHRLRRARRPSGACRLPAAHPAQGVRGRGAHPGFDRARHLRRARPRGAARRARDRGGGRGPLAQRPAHQGVDAPSPHLAREVPASGPSISENDLDDEI